MSPHYSALEMNPASKLCYQSFPVYLCCLWSTHACVSELACS